MNTELNKLGIYKKSLTIIMLDLGTGGTQTHVRSILGYLTQKFNVTVYCLYDPIEREDNDPCLRVCSTFKNIKLSQRPRFIIALLLPIIFLKLCAHLVRNKPDIVHFFLPLPYIIGAIAAKISNSPIRIMSRRSLNEYQTKYPIVARLEKLLHRSMDAIVGNSNQVVEQLRGESIGKNIMCIPNGIEPPEVGKDFDLREECHLSADTQVILIVANLIKYKGHIDLLDALIRLNKEYGHWALVIVGKDFGLKKHLENMLLNTSIKHKVFFLGERKDIGSIIHQSDICLNCSHEEGMSNSILEYMSLGRPIIASAVGGNLDLITDRKTGLRYRSKSSLDLTMKLLELLNDKNLQEYLGRNGKLEFESQFRSSVCAQKYIDMYHKLLARTI